jgi:predicted nucleic acid-binding protein
VTPSKNAKRYALDANVLVSIVNSSDEQHFSCYSFFRHLTDADEACWVVPGLIFFEFQAAQSRRQRERPITNTIYRHTPLHRENSELYHVTTGFLQRVYELDLYNKFDRLRGADLVYACIAYIENIPLVTHDNNFDPYNGDLALIKPRDIYGTGDKPLTIGTVSLEKNDKIYTAVYEVFRGVVRLETGQATHTEGPGAELIARQMLSEIVNSGLADKLKLGKHA